MLWEWEAISIRLSGFYSSFLSYFARKNKIKASPMGSEVWAGIANSHIKVRYMCFVFFCISFMHCHSCISYPKSIRWEWGGGVREIKDWIQIFKIPKYQTLLWKIEFLSTVKDLTDLVQLVLNEWCCINLGCSGKVLCGAF